MTNRRTPKIPSRAARIIELLERGGATNVFVVGGFVRDFLLGVDSKDVDIEAYGLSYKEIERLLAPHFHVDLVGQAFGVIKVDNSVDVALPRRESKAGLGHKGFDVESRPDLDPAEAFARRDFTINAIGLRRDGSFYDPYDGIGDLSRGVLRATSPAFKDDPLRVLRGMQFASRFGFGMESGTVRMCREVFSEFGTLSEERIFEEWRKWARKGAFPERGLDVLFETGWIAGFPELNALVGCPQNPAWHPEGDVWTHTRNVCIAASKLLSEREPAPTDEEREIVMFAALCHDFGKPSTTKPDERGVLRSCGHAEAGAPLAVNFLERMKAPKRLEEMVEKLVERHMATQDFPEGVSDRAVRRLAARLAPANITLWATLCHADALGCGKVERRVSQGTPVRFRSDQWLEAARRLEVTESAPQPLVQGRNLIALGYKPSPFFGKILKEAFEAQLEGEFTTQEGGAAWLEARLKDGAEDR